MKQRSHTAMLVLTALIWGIAFVAQSKGGEYLSAYAFNGLRFLLAALALLPVILLSDLRSDSIQHKQDPESLFLISFIRPSRTFGGNGIPRVNSRASNPNHLIFLNMRHTSQTKDLWLAGILTGTLLCIASTLQQLGLNLGASAGKAGFLTTIYIIIVPILSFAAFRKQIHVQVWISVAIALAGLYLLCIDRSFSLMASDLLLIGCAFVFALQILSIDRFASKLDGLKLSAIEFLTCGILSSIVMIFTDILPRGFSRTFSSLLQPDAWIPLLYAGILSSGIGYTLQVFAQKEVEPAIASLIMSLESVFSVLAGWLILGQTLSQKELVGCVLVFVAVLLAQLPSFHVQPLRKSS